MLQWYTNESSGKRIYRTNVICMSYWTSQSSQVSETSSQISLLSSSWLGGSDSKAKIAQKKSHGRKRHLSCQKVSKAQTSPSHTRHTKSVLASVLMHYWVWWIFHDVDIKIWQMIQQLVHICPNVAIRSLKITPSIRWNAQFAGRLGIKVGEFVRHPRILR